MEPGIVTKVTCLRSAGSIRTMTFGAKRRAWYCWTFTLHPLPSGVMQPSAATSGSLRCLMSASVTRHRLLPVCLCQSLERRPCDDHAAASPPWSPWSLISACAHKSHTSEAYWKSAFRFQTRRSPSAGDRNSCRIQASRFTKGMESISRIGGSVVTDCEHLQGVLRFFGHPA